MSTWGATTTSTQENIAANALVIPFDAFPENGTLNSIDIDLNYHNNGVTVRVGLLSGGTSASNSQNAALVEDLGVTPSTGLTISMISAGASLVAGTRYWAGLKTDQSGGFGIYLAGAEPGGSNLASTYHILSGVTTDEATAWPSSLPNTSSPSGSGYWSVRLNYTPAATSVGSEQESSSPMIVQASRPNVPVFARSMARAARKAIGDFRPRGSLWLPEAYAR